MSAQDLEQRARELLAEAFSDAGAFSAADTLLRTAYVTDYKTVVALRAIVAALRQQPAPAVDDAMVERLARAWCDQTNTGFDALPEAGRQLCQQHMRIALTAAIAREQGVQS